MTDTLHDNQPMSYWAPLPPPLGVHPDSAAGRMFGIVVDDETYVCWCCRNECGAVFSKTQGVWTLTTPIVFEDFLESLDANGVLPIANRDWAARRWIKACRLASGEINNDHGPQSGRRA